MADSGWRIPDGGFRSDSKNRAKAQLQLGLQAALAELGNIATLGSNLDSESKLCSDESQSGL